MVEVQELDRQLADLEASLAVAAHRERRLIEVVEDSVGTWGLSVRLSPTLARTQLAETPGF
jgi:hypothetical protein